MFPPRWWEGRCSGPPCWAGTVGDRSTQAGPYWFSAAVLAGCLGFVEGYAMVAERHRKTHYASGGTAWVVPDSILGYAPRPGVNRRETKYHGRDTVHSVTFRLSRWDSASRRPAFSSRNTVLPSWAIPSPRRGSRERSDPAQPGGPTHGGPGLQLWVPGVRAASDVGGDGARAGPGQGPVSPDPCGLPLLAH